MISLLTGAVVERTVKELVPDPQNGTNVETLRVEIATSLALLVGIIQVLMGVTGLGKLIFYSIDRLILILFKQKECYLHFLVILLLVVILVEVLFTY